MPTRAITGAVCVLAVAGGALTALVVSSGAASATGAASWTLDAEAEGLGQSISTGISCATPTYCIDLGGGNPNSYIWNDGTWTVAGFADPGGQLQMNSLSCVSELFCMAGGELSGKAIIEEWNGSNWSVVPDQESPANSTIQGVSCATSTACAAVGQNVIENWNGLTWSAAAWAGLLYSVSCSSPTNCVAVGGPNSPVSLVYDGTSWSTVDVPIPGSRDFLYSVSCASTTYCVAVGSTEYDDVGWGLTLIEVWNGSSWSISPSPDLYINPTYPNTGGILMSVSCASPDACVAAGYGSGPGNDANGLEFPSVAMIETWDGTAWSLTTTPAPVDPDGVPGVSLYAVGCVGGGSGVTCMAGGDNQDPNQPPDPDGLVLESSSAIGTLVPTSTDVQTSVGTATATVTASALSGTSESASSGKVSASRFAAQAPTSPSVAARYGSEQINAPQPTGTVALLNNGNAISGCPTADLDASGQVSCDVSGLSGPFTAVYSGDNTYDGSTNGTNGGSPPTTTTTTSTTSTSTTSTTVPNTTSTTSTSTTSTTVPITTTTAVSTPTPTITTTTTTTTTVANTPITATTGSSPVVSTSRASAAWLSSRVLSVGALGTIATSVTTHQAGVAEVAADYEVKVVTVAHHRLTSRTEDRPFGTIESAVPRGTTSLVVHPSAAALAALRRSGTLDVIETVYFRATGTQRATQTWRVLVRLRP